MSAQSTYSLVLNGTGYVDVPNQAALSLSGSFSISLWVKLASVGSYQGLVTKCSSSTAIRNYDLDVDPSGNIRFFFTQGPLVYVGFTGNTSLSAGTWYHVGFSYDGSAQRIYVNGSADGTNSATGGADTVTDAVRFGDFIDGSLPLNGELDDIALFNTVLTPTQFANIAGTPGVAGSSTLDIATLSPVGLWRAEAGSGSTITDTSGSGNDGTITGGVTWSSLNDVALPLQVGGGISGTFFNANGPGTITLSGSPETVNVDNGEGSVTVTGGMGTFNADNGVGHFIVA